MAIDYRQMHDLKGTRLFALETSNLALKTIIDASLLALGVTQQMLDEEDRRYAMVRTTDLEEGVYAERTLTDGRVLQVRCLLWGYAYLSIGPAGQRWYDDTWQYQQFTRAMNELVWWDGAPGTEPTGWYKHPASGRRREDGDPTKETRDG